MQANKFNYYKDYDHLERFISYFYQIDLVMKLEPENVLEIGIGNKTVSNYLKQHCVKTDTCDFDSALEPDYIADIRQLPFKNNSYDLILACEILEHIPWADVDKALQELHRITKKHVIISIPYSAAVFEAVIHFTFIRKITRKQFMDILVRIPAFFASIHFDGQHYWMMGRRGYSIIKVRKAFRKYFIVLREVKPVLQAHHHFFVLEKKQ